MELSERRHNIACGLEMDFPAQELGRTNLPWSWVYDREIGIIPVGGGYHCVAMATLFAWENGYDTYVEASLDMDISTGKMADKWLEKEGRAFKSSVSDDVIAVKGMLNFQEKKLFAPLNFI